MHFKSNSLINYIATKFLLRGLIASNEDIARVFNYEEEYYQDNPDIEDMEVILTHEDDILNYIRSQNPEFSQQDILKILDSLDNFHQDVLEAHYNDNNEREY